MEWLVEIYNVVGLVLVNTQDALATFGNGALAFMMTAAIGFAGIMWGIRKYNIAWTAGGGIAVALAGSVLIASLQWLSEIFLSSIVTVAIAASGGGTTAHAFLSDPSPFMRSGYAIAAQIMDFGEVGNPMGVIIQSISMSTELKWAYGLAAAAVLIIHMIYAITFCVAILFYKFSIIFSPLLIPLAVVPFFRSMPVMLLRYFVASLLLVFAIAWGIRVSTLVMTAMFRLMPAGIGDVGWGSLIPPLGGALFMMLLLRYSQKFASTVAQPLSSSASSVIAPAMVAGAIASRVAGMFSRGGGSIAQEAARYTGQTAGRFGPGGGMGGGGGRYVPQIGGGMLPSSGIGDGNSGGSIGGGGNGRASPREVDAAIMRRMNPDSRR